MNEHAMSHTELIRTLADLHDKADRHARELMAINDQILLMERELAEIQKPAEDWE